MELHELARKYETACEMVRAQIKKMKAEIKASNDPQTKISLQVNKRKLEVIASELNKTAKYLYRWEGMKVVRTQTDKEVFECERIYARNRNSKCRYMDGRKITP